MLTLAVLTAPLGDIGRASALVPRTERIEYLLKAVLIVRGPVTALTDQNTLLVLSNAGSLPYPLNSHCLMFRFRVFDVITGTDVTAYDPGIACAGGDATVVLPSGGARRFSSLLPDVTALPPGRYRLEAYFRGEEQKGAPVATTTFTKAPDLVGTVLMKLRSPPPFLGRGFS